MVGNRGKFSITKTMAVKIRAESEFYIINSLADKAVIPDKNGYRELMLVCHSSILTITSGFLLELEPVYKKFTCRPHSSWL